MYENHYESLINGLTEEIIYLKQLISVDPQLAKKESIKKLQSAGILDKNSNLKSPYNGQKVNKDDFTRGPQLHRKKIKNKLF